MTANRGNGNGGSTGKRTSLFPVQLLKDNKGIYGLGVADDFKDQPEDYELILRPDRLQGQSSFVQPRRLTVLRGEENTFIVLPSGGLRVVAMLQMIPSIGQLHRMFRNFREEHLRKLIHGEMLRREGLHPGETRWPLRSDGTWGNFWTVEPTQEKINRNKYHGLRRASLAVMNGLISEALEAAANAAALKQARRFGFRYRYEIYCAAATSQRFLQLTDTFPTLAWAIVSSQDSARRAEAIRLVEAGAALRAIASLMVIPMVFRAVKPGAAHLLDTALDPYFTDDPDLLRVYMPQSLPGMKAWLNAVRYADGISDQFAKFVARNFLELGQSHHERRAWIQDAADWVRACMEPQTEGHAFITRRFSPNMSVNTVSVLSSEWHEAVASNLTGPLHEFPQPWAPGSTIGGFDIVPLTDNGELYREGRAMHHCVGTYGAKVRDGDCYLYSVRKDDEKMATFELVRMGNTASVNQIRGPRNRPVSKSLDAAVQKWLKSQSAFKLPEAIKTKVPSIFPDELAHRPIIVPRDIAPPDDEGANSQQAITEDDSSEAEGLFLERCRVLWGRGWSPVVTFDAFVQKLRQGEYDVLIAALADLDLAENDADDTAFELGDSNRLLGEYYAVGDPEYDAEGFDVTQSHALL